MSLRPSEPSWLRLALALTALWVVLATPGLSRAADVPAPIAGLRPVDPYMVFALTQVPDEIYGQPIVEIRFEGNRRVESEAMLLELDSQVGELAQARTIANDLRRLW